MSKREGEREMSDVRIVHELGDPQISTMTEELLASRDHAYVPFSICQVPPSIRKADLIAYEPQIISIGPYHHQNPNLPDMGGLKRRYMHSLLDRNTAGTSRDVLLKQCIEKVNQSEARARECYQVPSSLSSYDFVMMLVLDGCFILELLHTSYRQKAVNDPIYTIAWMFTSIWEDLLKLENQIPFFILEDLFGIVVSETTLSIKLLAFFFFRKRALRIVESDNLDEKEVSHLLHFFYILHRPYGKDGDCTPSTPKPSCLPSFYKPIYKKMKSLLPIQHHITMTPEEADILVPCIVRLQEAGIKFRENIDARNMLDVTFQDGILSFPHLTINDSTNSILRNLLAFELFCPNNDHHISHYITFLDYIVNSANDITILQQCKIINNMLGSEREVAMLFNKLGRNVNLRYGRHHYLENVFERVNEYCDSKWHKHRATCMRDYFNSPWTIISVLAAIAVIVMTLIQVIYAILEH